MFPALAPDGSCGGDQQLPFLRDVAPFSCTLASPFAPINLADECSYALNASFLEDMFIATDTAPQSVVKRATTVVSVPLEPSPPLKKRRPRGHGYG